MHFSVDLVALEDETILTLHGELDIWTQRDLVTAIAAVGNDVPRIVLDLLDLRSIDVASIGIIHQHRTIMEQRGGLLEIRSPNSELRRILEITGMIADRSQERVQQHRIVLPQRARIEMS